MSKIVEYLIRIKDETQAGFNRFRGNLQAMKREAEQSTQEVQSRFSRMSSGIQSSFNALSTRVTAVFGVIRTAALGLTAVFGTLSAGIFASARSAGQYEILKLRLQAVTGSALEAEKVFTRLRKFSEGTPLDLKSIVEAEILLRSFGVTGEDSISKIAGAAVVFQRNISDIANSIGSLNSQSLRSLGIQLNTLGDQFTFTFRDAARGGEEVIRVFNGMSAARKGLVDILGASGEPLLGEASNTLFGALSTLRDNIGNLFASIGQGFIVQLTQAVQNLTGAVQKLEQSDFVNKLGNHIGYFIGRITKIVDLMSEPLFKEQGKQELNNLFSDIAGVFGGIVVSVLIESARFIGNLIGKGMGDAIKGVFNQSDFEKFQTRRSERRVFTQRIEDSDMSQAAKNYSQVYLEIKSIAEELKNRGDMTTGDLGSLLADADASEIMQKAAIQLIQSIRNANPDIKAEDILGLPLRKVDILTGLFGNSTNILGTGKDGFKTLGEQREFIESLGDFRSIKQMFTEMTKEGNLLGQDISSSGFDIFIQDISQMVSGIEQKMGRGDKVTVGFGGATSDFLQQRKNDQRENLSRDFLDFLRKTNPDVVSPTRARASQETVSDAPRDAWGVVINDTHIEAARIAEERLNAERELLEEIEKTAKEAKEKRTSLLDGLRQQSQFVLTPEQQLAKLKQEAQDIFDSGVIPEGRRKQDSTNLTNEQLEAIKRWNEVIREIDGLQQQIESPQEQALSVGDLFRRINNDITERGTRGNPQYVYVVNEMGYQGGLE